MKDCQETAGFLFKHACGRPAEAECDDCAKPVCGRHLKPLDGAQTCVTCTKLAIERRAAEGGPAAGGRRRSADYGDYADDPYFYGFAHYEGYGSYRQGSWGHELYGSTRHDPADFTEADGESLRVEGDEGWEQDMGAS